MPITHSHKNIETPLFLEAESFDDSVRAVCDMDPVGFAFGSTHPCICPQGLASYQTLLRPGKSNPP
jgi:hypothetical protein